MKKCKKLISIILTVVMLLTAFPVSALAASNTPAKPALPTYTSTTTSIKLNWKKVSGANGYVVYKYNSSTKKYSKLATTTKLTYTASKLKTGTNYVYALKAYKTVKKKKYYSAYSSKLTATTLPAKPTGLKASAKTQNSVTLSWSKVNGATGYEVYSYNSSTNKYTKLVSTTKLTYKKTSLKPSTSYTYAVKAYKTLNNKKYYSAYSSKLTVKTNSAPIVPSKPDYSKTLSTVNESTKYQTIVGFGASGAWWAQRIGRWTDENALTVRDSNESLWTPAQTKNALMYLYDKNQGIGLNIYRYNLGTDSYKDTTIENKWERTEGFLDDVDEKGNFTFNWSKDQSAQNTLSVVKDLAGDDLKLTLFCNSPPTQLTENGLACCDDKGVDYWAGNGGLVNGTRYYLYHQNLPDNAKSYMLFAKYLTNVADHFIDEGYNVVDVSPVNEPQTAWSWGMGEDGVKRMSQEGCHYTPAGMSKLAAYCAIAGEGKPYKFSMFDSGAADGANENDLNCSSIKYIDRMYNYSSKIKDENDNVLYDKAGNSTFAKININYYTNISLHSYWSDKNAKQEFADYVSYKYPNVKSYTCTEYCQMTNDVNTGVWDISSPIPWWDPARNGLTIEYGVQLARIMYEDFTTLNATEWDWWTACSGGYYPDGLVYINYQNPDDVQTSKRLWAMGNYSKFIHEGAVRVNIQEAQSSILSTAWKNKDGSLVVVYINQNDNDMSVNLKADDYSTSSTYVTSADKDLENVSNSSYSIDNAVSIPAQSVVTVVLK